MCVCVRESVCKEESEGETPDTGKYMKRPDLDPVQPTGEFLEQSM